MRIGIRPKYIDDLINDNQYLGGITVFTCSVCMRPSFNFSHRMFNRSCSHQHYDSHEWDRNDIPQKSFIFYNKIKK